MKLVTIQKFFLLDLKAFKRKPITKLLNGKRDFNLMCYSIAFPFPIIGLGISTLLSMENMSFI